MHPCRSGYLAHTRARLSQVASVKPGSVLATLILPSFLRRSGRPPRRLWWKARWRRAPARPTPCRRQVPRPWTTPCMRLRSERPLRVLKRLSTRIRLQVVLWVPAEIIWHVWSPDSTQLSCLQNAASMKGFPAPRSCTSAAQLLGLRRCST